MRTYEDVTGWRDYLPFFPEELRDGVERLVEERWTWRGMEIHIDRLPAPAAKVKLLLVHGAGAYGRILAPWATALGVEVIAPDLPGYGLSDVAGHLVSYDDWVDCVAALVIRERERDDRPIVLFGGSMGGMIAYSAAAQTGAHGLIVTCLLDPRSAEVRRAVAFRPWLGRAIGPMLRAAGPFTRVLDRARIPIRWISNMASMSNEPRLSALCGSDRLGGGGTVTFRWLRTFLGSIPAVEPERFTACPVLLVHPADDRWTPAEVTLPFFERLRVKKTLVLLERAGHFPVEQPGIGQLDRAVRQFLSELGVA